MLQKQCLSGGKMTDSKLERIPDGIWSMPFEEWRDRQNKEKGDSYPEH